AAFTTAHPCRFGCTANLRHHALHAAGIAFAAVLSSAGAPDTDSRIRQRSHSGRRRMGRNLRYGGGPALVAAALLMAGTANATPFSFSTNGPDGKMATASRPENGSQFEIESADDFIAHTAVRINSATFTGLVPSGASVQNVVVEIYRVFPLDSTAPPPGHERTGTNSSPSVSSSPSRAFASNTLTFSTNVLSPSFSVLNSVTPGGIHPSPGQTTGGNGQQTGQEVEFDVTFTAPFLLPGDHYFFVPQVQLSDDNTF